MLIGPVKKNGNDAIMYETIATDWDNITNALPAACYHMAFCFNLLQINDKSCCLALLVWLKCWRLGALLCYFL